MKGEISLATKAFQDQICVDCALLGSDVLTRIIAEYILPMMNFLHSSLALSQC